MESRIKKQEELAALPEQIRTQEKHIENTKCDIEFYSVNKVDYKSLGYVKQKEIRDAIFDAVKTHVNMPSEKRVLTFQGFDIVVPARMHPKQMTEEERKEGEGLQGIPYIFVKRHGAHYMEIHSNSGITRALNNLLEGLPDKLKHQEDVLETLKQRLHDVELDLQTPGETYAAEMQTLKERIEQINEELGLVA